MNFLFLVLKLLKINLETKNYEKSIMHSVSLSKAKIQTSKLTHFKQEHHNAVLILISKGQRVLAKTLI